MSSESNKTVSSGDELLARDEKYVLRPWTGTGEPVPVVKAEGCEVTDAYGTTFLDMTSGYFVNQAGHCHPKVAKAATEQLTKVTQVSGRHTTPAVVDLAETLITNSPESVKKVFFATGGSEANEFALKMVRQKTGRSDLLSMENAYHGLTLGVLGGCASEKYRKTAGIDLPDNFVRIGTPYCYRCPAQKDCALQCLDGVDETIAANPKLAAFIAEPIQAVGGIIPPKKWWERMDELRKKRGLLLILDEIQTGAGRTGKMFAAEHYDLQPDIIVAGKGLSGGVGSLGVVLSSDEVIDGFYGGTTPTNGGNAVSAAAGNALLGVLLEEGLIENAAKMGEYFTEKVAALNDPWVGDIRFAGLLGGVELVTSRESKEILPKPLVLKVKDHLHSQGMLITVSGLHGNVLRLQPSLSVSSAQLDVFTEALAKALTSVREAA